MSNLDTLECEIAQENFLRNGGIFAGPLAKKIKAGEISRNYVFREYPKAVKINCREESVDRTTETCRGTMLSWTERRTVWDEIIVNSEEEEERVLAGGATSTQIEEQRQQLYRRCLSNGIQADPAWTSVRLKRELGEKLDEVPKDDLAALREKLAQLEEVAALKARIAELEAQNAAPEDDAESLRSELQAAGVRVDARWGVRRLREELDRVTTPSAA